MYLQDINLIILSCEIEYYHQMSFTTTRKASENDLAFESFGKLVQAPKEHHSIILIPSQSPHKKFRYEKFARCRERASHQK